MQPNKTLMPHIAKLLGLCEGDPPATSGFSSEELSTVEVFASVVFAFQIT